MFYKMSRFVADQRAAFDSNELFRRLSVETETKYIGYLNNNIEDRRLRFQASCRNGRAEIAFISCGFNIVLICFPWNSTNVQGVIPPKDYVNFEKEHGKVYLKAPFILNGVCVCYKGWIDLSRLDGMGCIEFDEERAQIETMKIAGGSGQQLVKMGIPKSQSLKHPAPGGSASEIDKRPRLH